MDFDEKLKFLEEEIIRELVALTSLEQEQDLN